MKKYLLFVILFTLLLTGCQSNNSESKKDKNNPFEYMFEHGGSVNIKNLNCSDLENNDIVDVYFRSTDHKYFLLSNGKVYYFTNDLYSNNQQCKPVSEDLKFKSIDYNLITEDNKYYEYLDGEIHPYEFDYLSFYNQIPSSLLDNPNISNIEYMSLNEEQRNKYKETSSNNKITTYTKWMYIKDGSIYEGFVQFIYKIDYQAKTATEISNKLVEEKVLYSSEDYGNITDYKQMEWLNDESMITSDKGIYRYRDVETEECKKYDDIKCEKKFVRFEKFDKYMDDVKFMNTSIIVTKDNSFIEMYGLLSHFDNGDID